MELHTLGVNGGYTQKDVTEVARVFTGWTLKQPKQGGALLSKSVCTSLATRSFSDTASNLTAKKKDEKCCNFSPGIPRPQSLFAESWRHALCQTIHRPL